MKAFRHNMELGKGALATAVSGICLYLTYFIIMHVTAPEIKEASDSLIHLIAMVAASAIVSFYLSLMGILAFFVGQLYILRYLSSEDDMPRSPIEIMRNSGKSKKGQTVDNTGQK